MLLGLKQSGRTGARLKFSSLHSSRRIRSASSRKSSSYWRINDELRQSTLAVVRRRVEKPPFRSQACHHGHATAGSLLECPYSDGAQLRYFWDQSDRYKTPAP